MVNGIWQHHFGEGIVRTPSNFGKMGEPPSHPELLDWLAVEFVERGWSIKAMHRLMMTSEAYQMASDDIAANVAIDPENRLFWRMPRQRLEAETIRDQILAVAGTLDRTLGGPNVFPYIDPDLFEASSKRNWPGKPDDDPSTWRRSLYVFSKRSIRYPLFETFDQPNLINSCDRRNRSTVAPQALLLMNNTFVLLQAKKFAERLRREAGDDVRRAGRPGVPRWRWRARPTRSSAAKAVDIRARRRRRPGRVLPRAVQPERVRLPPMSDPTAALDATRPAALAPRAALAARRRHRRPGVRRPARPHGLLARRSSRPNPLAPKPQHFPAKAKAVISIFCYGGVSQVDTFDPKPDSAEDQGETMTGVGEVRDGRWARPAG